MSCRICHPQSMKSCGARIVSTPVMSHLKIRLMFMSVIIATGQGQRVVVIQIGIAQERKGEPMSDLIDRQAAMDVPERFVKDCNPEHFDGHQKFIEYMDNAEIGSFGNWQFANGFNMGLTAAEVAIQNLPSAQPEIVRCKDCINYTRVKDEWGSCFENPMKLWRDTDYCSWAERRTDG